MHRGDATQVYLCMSFVDRSRFWSGEGAFRNAFRKGAVRGEMESSWPQEEVGLRDAAERWAVI